MDDDEYPIDPALDTVMILIAELMRAGVVKGEQIASMVRRLDLSELPEVAARLQMLHLSNEMDTPENNRGTFRVIDGGLDGGNDDA